MKKIKKKELALVGQNYQKAEYIYTNHISEVDKKDLMINMIYRETFLNYTNIKLTEPCCILFIKINYENIYIQCLIAS